MNIKEISIEEFENIAITYDISSYEQSISYALLMAESGYEYEFIEYVGMEVKALALILYKKIGSWYYGYSPRGFLIDYTNKFILDDFTSKLKEYYSKKHFAFIKINPEIAISKLDRSTNNFEYNTNYTIIDNLIKCGYKKLKTNMNFEALLPRVNAIVNLDSYSFNDLDKNTRIR